MRGRAASEEAAGDRLGLARQLRRRAHGDQLAAVHAAAGTEIDDQIGGLDRRLVVLDDQHACCPCPSAAEGAEQHGVVARMQADGRLVEDVADAAQVGAELRRQADALRLAAGQRVGAPVERQVGQADLLEEAAGAA